MVSTSIFIVGSRSPKSSTSYNMCSQYGNGIPAKTSCRIFAFLNLFLGLLSLYYWDLLSTFTDKIIRAKRWDSVMSLNEETTQTILHKCGQDYLIKMTPSEFGSLFKMSIQLYIAACVLFSIKGFMQFFVTCFGPLLARSFSIGLIIGDVFITCIILYGLYLFRSPQLCLLEHTDIFYHPNQQSHMTVVTFASLILFKLTELICLLCFICQQNKMIAAGEIRSKGVRRSEAFRTPMTSRANSYLYNCTGTGGPPGYFLLDKNNNEKIKRLGKQTSDEYLIQEEEEECRRLFLEKDFVEIDLIDNDNNNGPQEEDEGDHHLHQMASPPLSVTRIHVNPNMDVDEDEDCGLSGHINS